MKGMAALISTVILSAGSWLALHASLHNTLLSYSWLDSTNGTRSEADAAEKQGFGEEATNTSTYCAQHSPVERSISMPPLASTEVIEITSIKSLCDAWNDNTAKQYKVHFGCTSTMTIKPRNPAPDQRSQLWREMPGCKSLEHLRPKHPSTIRLKGDGVRKVRTSSGRLPKA